MIFNVCKNLKEQLSPLGQFFFRFKKFFAPGGEKKNNERKKKCLKRAELYENLTVAILKKKDRELGIQNSGSFLFFVTIV